MAGIQAGGSAGRLSIEIVAEIARLQADLDKAKRAVNAASGDIAKSAKAANDNLASMGSGLNKAGSTSKLAGHHVRNLAFQFQDLGVQMAGAAGSSEPLKMALMALLQQGAQIQGIMSQAGMGVKGLIAATAGMLAPFAPLLAALAAMAAGIALITAGINENSKVQVTWKDTLLGAYDMVKEYLTGQLTSAFQSFGVSTQDVWGKVLEWTKWAVNRLIGITSLVPRVILDNWRLIPAAAADIFFSTVNVSVDAINELIRKAVSGINGLISEANKILSKADLAIPTITAPQIARSKGAAAKLGAGIVKSLTDTMQRDFIGEAVNKLSPYAQARAVERVKKDAKKAGKEAGKAAAKAAQDAFADWDKLARNHTADAAADAAKQALKNSQADWEEMDRQVTNNGQFIADMKVADLNRMRDAAEEVNDQYRELIGTIGSMGKAGAGLGTLMGLLSGNTSAVGGKFGQLFNIGLGEGKNDKGEVYAKTIGTEFERIFKKDGKFSQALKPLFEGAGIGMTAASAIFGRQSTEEQIGAGIGGAIGGKIGDKLGKTFAEGSSKLLKGLGDFAGPLGSIVGGVLGNVLGGLFTKAKWGRVDLTAQGAGQAIGNNGASEKAALAAGNSILGGLNDLATQLGGVIGDFGRISVGVRKGDYRVNTGGTSLKVKKGAVDFGDDAEAAVAYAMKMAIERGAFQGIRQSTNNLLKAGDDLSTQLTKAMNFEGVFSDLKSYTDPVGFELDNIEKQFVSLRAIFKEAGASAEEYAQLEQLLTLRRQEAMDKERNALEDVRSRIAEAKGDETTVTAIARAKELKDALNDNVRAELKKLYAIEDEIAAQNKLTEAQEAQAAAAEQLRQAWVSLGTSLTDEINRIRGLAGGDSTASFAVLQGQFNAAVTAARGGDQDAAGKLVDLSQSLIEMAGKTATSRQELDRVRAQTAASLEGVYDMIGRITGSSTTDTPAAAINAAVAAVTQTGATAGSGTTDSVTAELRALREEVAGMRRDNNTGHSVNAGNTGAIKKHWDNVTGRSGGDAIATVNAA